MFNIFGDAYKVDFEIYIEDKLVQKQTMQAPKEILIMNFMQMANQIKPDRRPMKIRIARQEIVWDNFENKEKVLDLDVECCNEAMIIWQEGR